MNLAGLSKGSSEMYLPSKFEKLPQYDACDLIETYNFATLLTMSRGAHAISHIPLYLSKNRKYLLGHMATANPQSKILSDSECKITAVFQGPHHYISPSWYLDNPSNVPTWNYSVVHVEGTATIVKDEDKVLSFLSRTVALEEKRILSDWSLSDNKHIKKLLNAIVHFEIEISDMRTKFKMSQNQKTESVEGVISGLDRLDNDMAKETSRLMQFFLEGEQ